MNNIKVYNANFYNADFKEIKEGDTISMNKYDTNYLISQYHEKQLKDIKTATRLARRDCILDGELGDMAVKFADALNLATKSDRFNAVEMIPSEALTFSQKAYLSGLEVHEDVVIDELNKKCREVSALVSICDTYEQKLDILVRYDIIALPTKSKKTTKEK